MKALVLIACTFCLHAQISTTVKQLPDGATSIGIKNTSAIPLAAFAIAFQLTGGEGPHFIYFDELTDLTPPKRAFDFVPAYAVPRDRRSDAPTIVEPIVTAGIFADGATIGDAALIGRILLRRCNLLQPVETSLEMIADAGRHNVARDQLIKQFKTLADSVRRWYLPQEQQVGIRIYQPIIGKLINLPEPPLGEAFPPAAFVEQETAALNRRRTALLASQPSLADAALSGK